VDVTVVTSNGSPIPDDTQVCLDARCVDLDAIAAAAAPSGTVASFADVAPGTHALTVSVGGATVFTGQVEVVAGGVTMVTITLPIGGAATPGATVIPGTTAIPGDPTKPATGIVTLPSTGAEAGTVGSLWMWTLLLISAGLIGIAGAMIWRRRT
jgi:hypothetical protein